MCTDSNAPRTSVVRLRITRFVLAAVAALVVGAPSLASAQNSTVCGPEIKETVARLLTKAEVLPADEKLKLEESIYAQYVGCAQDASLVPSSFTRAVRQCGASASNVGSLFYEEMSCCGFDPQRRQFACPVKIKQTFGFGGPPLPGSREYVLHCVADAAGVLRPVGRDSVHLANTIGNQSPTWQFAVIAAANENLHTVYPMDGQTRRARSILSWGLQPTGCDYQPIWGNALNYRIRLDQ